MKITHNKVGQNLNLTDAGKAGKTDKADKAGAPKGGADIKSMLDTKAGDSANSASKVELSNRAQDMKRIKEVATSAPDIDEAKVAKYQKLIDDGKYEVDAEGLADKMVDEHMMYT
jgi:negative regulator of flagellin synthesis FlgM